MSPLHKLFFWFHMITFLFLFHPVFLLSVTFCILISPMLPSGVLNLKPYSPKRIGIKLVLCQETHTRDSTCDVIPGVCLLRVLLREAEPYFTPSQWRATNSCCFLFGCFAGFLSRVFLWVHRAAGFRSPRPATAKIPGDFVLWGGVSRPAEAEEAHHSPREYSVIVFEFSYSLSREKSHMRGK
jgi:hypothetical protein